MVDREHIQQVFKEQKRKEAELRSEPIRARKRRLQRIRDWIFAHQVEIYSAVYEDMKKPPREVDLSEIYPVLTEIRHTIRHLKEWTGREPFSGGPTYLGTAAYIQPEPKGACLIISPWNYPFNLAMGPLISALAAGNTVMMKPSEYTPATNQMMSRMCAELFEPEVFSIFEGEADMAGALLELPFDHVFFTGSPAVGKLVMEAASKNLTSVTLELGGKSPTIVDETASVKDAAYKIAWGKWLNAGQTCVAPDYVYVHDSCREAFLTALEQSAQHLYGREENYTSIISDRHFDRVNEHLQDALQKDGTLLFGRDSDKNNRRIYPAVILNPSEEMQIMQEEIFGPLLPVIFYKDVAEVIRRINERPKPLALYLFSRSRKNQRQFVKETSAGTMVINDCVLQFAHPSLPFGGVNNSGIGKAHGKAGFLAFSNEKSVLKQRTGFTMAKTVYPPYTDLKNWMIRFMLKYF